MDKTLITELSLILDRFTPMIILFIVGVVVMYNFRDMVTQWYIGLSIKWNNAYNEFDYFKIDDKKCLLVKIGAFRMTFLIIDSDGTLRQERLSISNKSFINGKIIKLGSF